MILLQILILLISIPCYAVTRSPVKEVQVFYKKTNSFEIFFEQKLLNKNLEKEIKNTGKMFYRKPGKFRLEYYRPFKKIFILNEKNFYFMNPGESVIYLINRCLNGDIVNLIFQSMEDPDSIEKKFDIIINNSERELILSPKNKKKYVPNLILTLDKKLFLIKELKLVDNHGNINIFKLRYISLNKRIPEKLFQIQSPDEDISGALIEDCNSIVK